MPIDPTAPTVEIPYVALEVEVTDARTGQLVHAARIALDGKEVAAGCCGQLVIQASFPHTLTVSAPGYQLWQVVLSPRNVRHDTIIKAPVRLQPAQPETRRGGGVDRALSQPAPR